MRLTEVRCYVLAILAAEGKLSIHRNGALEPSLQNLYGPGPEVRHPFSEKRMLTATADLHNEGYIQFRERGLHGVYKGQAELTKLGRHWLPVACAKLDQFAELRERHAAERVAFEEKRAEELVAFEEANQVLADDQSIEDEFVAQKIAAAQRVRAQLDLYRAKLGADMSIASIMVRVSDDTVVSLDTADLLLLCDTVEGQR